MDTLSFLTERYQLDTSNRSPLEIPGTREQFFPQLFKELGFKVGAEIGVERGDFSAALMEGMQGDVTLYGIDPWLVYSGYREHVSQNKLDVFYESVVNRFKDWSDNYRVVRAFSEEAHKHFRDESLDFVYIDGNHEFFYLTQDLHYWIPKVRKGGIVAGHDYRRNSHSYTNDTKDVIPAYMYAKEIKPWFVLREEHGPSSWFFVK